MLSTGLDLVRIAAEQNEKAERLRVVDPIAQAGGVSQNPISDVGVDGPIELKGSISVSNPEDTSNGSSCG